VSEAKATRLLQGYIWYPKDVDIDLGAYLPHELEGEVHLLWDEVRPPFAFFDDGTLAATQHIFQFTALTLRPVNPEGLTPWLAEVLQEKLEATPPGVGWQLMEDLRDL
jgi:hypothetical protein